MQGRQLSKPQTKGSCVQRWAVTLVVALSLALSSCNKLDNLINKTFPPPNALFGADQGFVNFDDTGNIHVTINNLEFASNSLFNPSSYIGVWVYKRGADARSICCYDEFENICTAAQENACMIGAGFSNDLAFAGDFYLDVHPPRPFAKYAASYHMPVYVADKTGVPQNYQGEYNTFSSPVNAVGDREQYDLYVGVFYSVWDSEGRLRPINIEAELTDVTYYSAARPDFLSPVIQIESRFYSEGRNDPPGSWYPIPHMASWTSIPPGLSLSLNGVKINEVGINIAGDGNNDFVELYNSNNHPVDLTLSGATLMRDSGCSVSTGSITQKVVLEGTIAAKGYFVVTQSDANLTQITNVNQFWSTSTSDGTIADMYCIILAKSKTSPTSPTFSNVIDWVTIGTGATLENGVSAPVPTNAAISRCPNGTDTNMNNADFQVRPHTPGAANSCP